MSPPKYKQMLLSEECGWEWEPKTAPAVMAEASDPPLREHRVVDHALAYAARGWHVFPSPPGGEKMGCTSAEKTNGNRWGSTKDPNEINAYFKKFPRANIGIATGPESGFFVVEADTPEGHDVDGIASLRELEAKHGALPETLMAVSPSGSQHRYFKWPAVIIRNSTSIIAPGVDVRGEGGMVIAPPSKRDKGRYKWLNTNEIADAPEWLVELCARSNGRLNERNPFSRVSNYPPAEREEIIAALAVIPSDDYGIWFEIGCALRKELGEDGFDLFDTWSKKSEKYNEIECRSKWTECAKVTAYDMGTIKYYANEASPGWRATYEPPPSDNLIQSSAEFVGNFSPPDYLIDGFLQRQFLYSLTAPTGAGKTCIAMRIAAHVDLGLPLDGKEIEKARVLFFAGENPDDVRMRWIKLCEELGHDPAGMAVFFLPGTPAIASDEIRKRIDAEAARYGPFGLLIVDTSAAYFRGDDENSNAQLGAHARMLRTFVNLPGGPTVLVTCHPTKNANMDNLLPRGGGAFLNEVDGNLVAVKENAVVQLHWHGKFRGPDFAPIPFKLTPGTTDLLKDRKGRLIWTVTAAPISEQEKGILDAVGRANQNEMLVLLQERGDLSLAEMAEALGWHYRDGKPNKSLANRVLASLLKEKLVVKNRGRVTLTKTGTAEAAKVPVRKKLKIR